MSSGLYIHLRRGTNDIPRQRRAQLVGSFHFWRALCSQDVQYSEPWCAWLQSLPRHELRFILAYKQSERWGHLDP